MAGPVDTARNTRELALLDPAGYELAFVEGPVDADRSFEDVMGPGVDDA